MMANTNSTELVPVISSLKDKTFIQSVPLIRTRSQTASTVREYQGVINIFLQVIATRIRNTSKKENQLDSEDRITRKPPKIELVS